MAVADSGRAGCGCAMSTESRSQCSRCRGCSLKTRIQARRRRNHHQRHRRTYSHKNRQIVAGGCALGSGCAGSGYAMSTEVRNPHSRCRAGSPQTRIRVRHRRKRHQRSNCRCSCKIDPPCRLDEGRTARHVSPCSPRSEPLRWENQCVRKTKSELLGASLPPKDTSPTLSSRSLCLNRCMSRGIA